MDGRSCDAGRLRLIADITGGARYGVPGVLPIEQVGPDIHRHVARVIGECFEVPRGELLDSWCDELMSLPALTTYAAFDGWDIVAVAALLVVDDSALLTGAATLPRWRRRGLYTSMLARRLRDAAGRGIGRVYAEVDRVDRVDDIDEATSDAASTPLRALRTSGFTECSGGRFARACPGWVSRTVAPGP